MESKSKGESTSQGTPPDHAPSTGFGDISSNRPITRTIRETPPRRQWFGNQGVSIRRSVPAAKSMTHRASSATASPLAVRGTSMVSVIVLVSGSIRVMTTDLGRAGA